MSVNGASDCELFDGLLTADDWDTRRPFFSWPGANSAHREKIMWLMLGIPTWDPETHMGGRKTLALQVQRGFKQVIDVQIGSHGTGWHFHIGDTTL